ncbi:MAG TPA: hypothetical protein PKA82_13225 [Pyrinomonadaceae bacterium]|nr:hypothetical protein [Pyrinomonadaceae bacterium]
MKKHLFIAALLFAVVGVFSVSSASAQKKVNVRFKAGTSSAVYAGSVAGYAYVDYVFTAKMGQQIHALLDGNNKAILGVMRNGLRIADDSTETREFSGELPANGTYIVRVGMMRADARRTKTPIRYSLEISITD